MEPKERADRIIKDMDIKHIMKWTTRGLPISMYKSQIYGCALVLCREMLEEVGKWKNTYMGKDQFEYWRLVEREIIKKKEEFENNLKNKKK